MNQDGGHLVEPGIKSYISQSLKMCNEIKKSYYTFYYNIVVFFLLILVVGGILWFTYKGKLSPVEKAIKMRKDREYILEKIRAIPKKTSSMITNLPKWNE